MQKDLGIFISDDLRWSNQIAHVVAKANRMLGFLRRHCTQLTNIRCRRLLYLTLVRSHLSYGSEIWSPQVSSRDLVLIGGIQRRATKFITQDYHSSYFCRLKSLNLLPISYWFEIKDLTFYYKCKSGGYEVDIDQYYTSNSNCPIRKLSLCHVSMKFIAVSRLTSSISEPAFLLTMFHPMFPGEHGVEHYSRRPRETTRMTTTWLTKYK